jgi:hypothetical protein
VPGYGPGGDHRNNYDDDSNYSGGRQNDSRQNEGRYNEGHQGEGRQNQGRENESRPQGNYGGGGGFSQGSEDFSSAAQHAQQHAGSDGDSGMFSDALSFLGQNHGRISNQSVNEHGMVELGDEKIRRD